jgi:hypothetical protein
MFRQKYCHHQGIIKRCTGPLNHPYVKISQTKSFDTRNLSTDNSIKFQNEQDIKTWSCHIICRMAFVESFTRIWFQHLVSIRRSSFLELLVRVEMDPIGCVNRPLSGTTDDPVLQLYGAIRWNFIKNMQAGVQMYNRLRILFCFSSDKMFPYTPLH